jgi:membrane protein DedA with SNARE-associated domain/rhodanese-related sulfurtransferase
MTTLLEWLQQYGLVVVFVNVLLAHLGLPLPAYPVLVITGALSARGHYALAALLPTAVAASLCADFVWYAAGRRYGGRMLRTICRVSMSPDSCVRQTESMFERWGLRSLVVARFIPGFTAIATTIAGNLRASLLRFAFFDAIGAALWAGLGLGIGYVFYDTVAAALDRLAGLGRVGLAVVAAGFAAFVAYRWLQRRALIRELRMARIDVDALRALQEAGERPAILDVRAAASRARDGHIPGSIPWSVEHGRTDRLEVARNSEVVVYCACPNEASAAIVAKRLQQAGFRHVRPLHGGIDAWVAAGLPLERETDAEDSAEAAT